MGQILKNASNLEKWVTFRKMGHTWKNGSHQDGLLVTLGNNGSHLEKWVTLGKNGSHLQNWVTLGKMSHTWKEWVTVAKLGHTWKNGSHLEKWVKLGKMSHTWKNESNLKKWVTLEKMSDTLKNGSHFKKWVTLGKMGQSLKNGSYLEKWVTFGTAEKEIKIWLIIAVKHNLSSCEVKDCKTKITPELFSVFNLKTVKVVCVWTAMINHNIIDLHWIAKRTHKFLHNSPKFAKLKFNARLSPTRPNITYYWLIGCYNNK